MFDVHVHSSPDIVPRRGDDHDIVRSYADAGFTGCVLKGHYESTVGRAAAANRNSPITVYGGIALNQHVGGPNPAAVAACLDAGGRVVWMPTADAHTQRTAELPSLCGARPGLASHSYAIPPVDWSAAEAAQEICALVAEADAVLATGHLSGPEAEWLLTTAQRHGVRRFLLTHPNYTVPALSAVDTAEMTTRGALAEITTFQLLHQPGCTPPQLAAFAERVGLDKIVLSSDAGQPNSPQPPEALQLLVDALAGEGLDRDALMRCASDIPSALITP